ncbi:hypothetical protein JCM8097_001627 [Rhodosporidiobolus ruineniae]
MPSRTQVAHALSERAREARIEAETASHKIAQLTTDLGSLPAELRRGTARKAAEQRLERLREQKALDQQRSAAYTRAVEDELHEVEKEDRLAKAYQAPNPRASTYFPTPLAPPSFHRRALSPQPRPPPAEQAPPVVLRSRGGALDIERSRRNAEAWQESQRGRYEDWREEQE